MRIRGDWRGTVAVLAAVTLAAAGRAGEPEGDASAPAKPGSTSWLNGLFHSKDSSGEKKLDPDHEGSRELIEASQSIERQTRGGDVARKREMTKLLRRMAVCDELRRVALQQKDDALLAEADQLLQHSQALYDRRIAHLGPDAPAAEPARAAGKDKASADGPRAGEDAR